MKVLKFVQFLCVDMAARDKLLDSMSTIAEYSASNEPGVLKLAGFVPVGDQEGNAVFSLQEYADEDAYAAHLEIAAVQDLRKLAMAEKLYSAEPEVHTLEAPDGWSFVRDTVAGMDADDIFYAVRRFEFTEDEAADVMADSTVTADIADKKENMLSLVMYGKYHEAENPTVMWTVEGFEDETAFDWTHPGEDDADGYIFMSKVGGYLTK